MELRNKKSQQHNYAQIIELSQVVPRDHNPDVPEALSSTDDKTTTSFQNHHQGNDHHVLTPVTLCILAAETGERFAYFGFRAILVLYFVNALELEETDAIACYAYTTSLAYLSPLVGAWLADGYWGRYTTILRCGVIYILGLAILTVAAWWDSGSLWMQRIWTALGLVLVCSGTGGIKPCVSAFGADQVAFSSPNNDDHELKTSYHDDPSSSVSDGTLDPRQDQRRGGDGLMRTAASAFSEVESRTQRVRTFFACFYFCINVGAVTSIAVVPIVKQHWGFGPAFSLSLWFMLIAICLFASKRREYYHIVPGQDGSSLFLTVRLCWWLFRKNIWHHSAWVRNIIPCLEPEEQQPQSSTRIVSNENDADPSVQPHQEVSKATRSIQDDQLSDAARVLHVIPIFCALPIFWCLYDQQSSVWTLQATKMSLHGLQPEQLNVVNPVEIMIFIPLFERIIYPLLEKARVDISHLRRMQWGMFFSAISFFASGIVESWVQHNEQQGLAPPSVLWQLIQITLLAIGEIFVSVTGLEFAYSCAPDRVKAIIMSLFLLTTAVGNIFSGCLYATVFADMNRATVMHVCAVLMLLNMGMFFFLSQWWIRQSPEDKLVVVNRPSGLVR